MTSSPMEHAAHGLFLHLMDTSRRVSSRGSSTPRSRTEGVVRRTDSLDRRRGKARGDTVGQRHREFTSNAILDWASKAQVKWHYIYPASPSRRPKPSASTPMGLGGPTQQGVAMSTARTGGGRRPILRRPAPENPGMKKATLRVLLRASNGIAEVGLLQCECRGLKRDGRRQIFPRHSPGCESDSGSYGYGPLNRHNSFAKWCPFRHADGESRPACNHILQFGKPRVYGHLPNGMNHGGEVLQLEMSSRPARFCTISGPTQAWYAPLMSGCHKQPREVSLAIAIPGFSLAMTKIQGVRRSHRTGLDIGITFLETLQTRHQPLQYKRTRRRVTTSRHPGIMGNYFAGAACNRDPMPLKEWRAQKRRDPSAPEGDAPCVRNSF